MPDILFTIILPVPALLLFRSGRPLAWQIGATTAVFIVFAAISEAWFQLSRDTYSWHVFGHPPVPRDSADMVPGQGYAGSETWWFLLQGSGYALAAIFAWAQQHWRRVFLARAAAILFWVSVAAFVVAKLALLLSFLNIARSEPLTSRFAEFAGHVHPYAYAFSAWALFGLQVLLAIGLLLLIPGILRWIRYAL